MIDLMTELIYKIYIRRQETEEILKMRIRELEQTVEKLEQIIVYYEENENE